MKRWVRTRPGVRLELHALFLAIVALSLPAISCSSEAPRSNGNVFGFDQNTHSQVGPFASAATPRQIALLARKKGATADGARITWIGVAWEGTRI